MVARASRGPAALAGGGDHLRRPRWRGSGQSEPVATLCRNRLAGAGGLTGPSPASRLPHSRTVHEPLSAFCRAGGLCPANPELYQRRQQLPGPARQLRAHVPGLHPASPGRAGGTGAATFRGATAPVSPRAPRCAFGLALAVVPARRRLGAGGPGLPRVHHRPLGQRAGNTGDRRGLPAGPGAPVPRRLRRLPGGLAGPGTRAAAPAT